MKKIFSKRLLSRLLVISLGVFPGLWARQAGAVVDPQRMAHFTKGLNLEWDGLISNKSGDGYKINSQDLDLIKQLGFRYVRVCVTPDLLFGKPNDPESLKPAGLATLDAKLNEVEAAGLSVIVSFVDWDGVTFQKLLANSDGTETEVFGKFVNFWNVFAKHLSIRDPEKTFLEILNEPSGVLTNQNWMPMQEKLADTIRAAAPDHTIIASCAGTSFIEGLNDGVEFVPLADPNVLYVIHNYTPGILCFPSWYKDYDQIHGDPYPSNPTNVQPVIDSITCTGDACDLIREKLKEYGQGCVNDGQGCNGQGWNLNRLKKYLQPMKDWADRYNASVMMGEFGVHREQTTPEDRARFLHDTVSIMKEWGIPWAMWAYRGPTWGIEKKEALNLDHLTIGDVDFRIIKALGLKVPPR